MQKQIEQRAFTFILKVTKNEIVKELLSLDTSKASQYSDIPTHGLSKAFDCLSHKLLLAKLHAYGFSLSALRLIHNYLTNRKQRTKIKSSYSSWEEILFGVPQGSILGHLLFTIFLCDMFFVVSQTDFAAYADDNTSYVEGNYIDEVINMLENDSVQLFKWFSDNQMKANKDKCHLIVRNNGKVSMNIDSIEVENSHCEKLLGVKVDRELKFKEHLEGIIKKASKKVNVLYRITPYMNIDKRKLLMNSFFISQFNYCPLIWMCHCHTINNKINSLHESCLRIIYNDYRSSFEYLLDRDKGVTIHLKNVRTLAIEMFKVSKNLSPQLVTEIFEKRNVYDLKIPSEFVRPQIRSVFNGEESISYLGPKIWDIVPSELKAL